MRRWKLSFHLNISSTRPLHLRWCPAICDTHLMESSSHASNCQKIWSWMIVTKPRGCNLPHPKLELPEDFLSEEGSGWFRSWGGNYQSPQCWPGNDDGGGLVNCPTRWYLYCPLGICIDHLVGGGKHIWGVTNCFGHSRAEMGDFGPVFHEMYFLWVW